MSAAEQALAADPNHRVSHDSLLLAELFPGR
jgi:hypothetical protein